MLINQLEQTVNQDGYKNPEQTITALVDDFLRHKRWEMY